MKEIMTELSIMNETQINTWWRWRKNGETYRLSQSIGKQYSYGKGCDELNTEGLLVQEN